MSRRALFDGIGEQNGSDLAGLLFGIELIDLELTDGDAVAAAVREFGPDETYYPALAIGQPRLPKVA